MRSNGRKIFDDFTSGIENSARKYKYRKKAKMLLKNMNGGYECNKEYKNVVLPYWKKYGKRPKKYWYKIFSARDSIVDPRYIPDDFFYGEIVPYYSNQQFRRCAEDKCNHDLIFNDVKRPKTILKNMAGIFYDSNMNIINFDEAVELCLSSKQNFLIKPSIDSGEGRLIQFFNLKNVNKNEIIDCLNSFKANFIVQEEIKQHESLRKLNSTSVNTIRVVSFLFENEVHILSSILRIGSTGSKVDNIGAGGYACAIKDNGYLNDKCGNNKWEWIYETNEGIKFADIKVPSYGKIIDVIKVKHKRLPHFKIIGWDFSVSTEGEPIFIEYNSCPRSNQTECGPTFGDLTEKVLEDVYITKKLKYAQN